jgi:hypothetical protein
VIRRESGLLCRSVDSESFLPRKQTPSIDAGRCIGDSTRLIFYGKSLVAPHTGCRPRPPLTFQNPSFVQEGTSLLARKSHWSGGEDWELSETLNFLLASPRGQ